MNAGQLKYRYVENVKKKKDQDEREGEQASDRDKITRNIFHLLFELKSLGRRFSNPIN